MWSAICIPLVGRVRERGLYLSRTSNPSGGDGYVMGSMTLNMFKFAGATQNNTTQGVTNE